MSLNITGSAPSGGPSPAPRCYGEGRLLLIIPKEERTGKKFESEETQQEIVCDIVALPDPSRPATPILFGGKANANGTMKEPDTHRVDVGPQGWLATNVVISSQGMVFTLRRVLEQRQAIVGRLWRDEAHRGAWKIAGDGHDATDAEIAIANQWSQAFFGNTFTNSVPVPIAGIPAQAPAGQPAYNPYGPPAPQQQAPAMPYNPGYAAPQQPVGTMPYGYPQQAAQVPQAAPVDAPPPGVDPALWASWDEATRQGARAFYAQQAQQVAQQPPVPAGAVGYPGVGTY